MAEYRSVTGESVNHALNFLEVKPTNMRRLFRLKAYGEWLPTEREWRSRRVAQLAADISQLLMSAGEPVPVDLGCVLPRTKAPTPLLGSEYLLTDATSTICAANIIGVDYLNMPHGRKLPLLELVSFTDPPTDPPLVITLPDLAREVQMDEAHILWPPAVQQK